MFRTLDLFLAMGFAWMISGMVLLTAERKNGSVPFGLTILLIFGLTLTDNFIKPGMLNPLLVRGIFIISRNSYFLIGPALWFYTRSLLNPGRGLSAILHLTPFALGCLLFVLHPELPLHPPLPPRSPGISPGLLRFTRDFGSVLSRLIYSILTLRMIAGHARRVPDFYSRLTIRNTLSWLYRLVLAYTLLFLLNALTMVLPLPGADGFQQGIGTAVRILPSLLFIFFFSHLARNQGVPEDRILEIPAGDRMKHGETASEAPGKAEPEEPPADSTAADATVLDAAVLDAADPGDKGKKKYGKSGMGEAESSALFERLELHMRENKPYLNSELTLEMLSREMGESRHRLSEGINRKGEESFYGYVNSYRIRECLAALKEERYPDYTILAVAFECGFKSASTFYTLFKKNTGKTPKEYIRATQKIS